MASAFDLIAGTYVTIYNRAADPAGAVFWANNLGFSSLAAASSPGTANLALADQLGTNFYAASSAAFNALYPTSMLDSQFINNVYVNLGGLGPDGVGATFWGNRLTSLEATNGQQVARSIVAAEIAFTLQTFDPNATGDAKTRADTYKNKIAVSEATATTGNASFNPLSQSTSDPAYGGLTNVLIGVSNTSASLNGALAQVQAANTANNPALMTGQFQTSFSLTPNIDTFTATAAGTTFSALPFVQSSGLANNTLNTGDSLQDSFKDGTLNYTAANNGFAANPPFAAAVTLNGVSTANITNTLGATIAGGPAIAGFQGNVTGLTTANTNNSLATVQVGASNQGLNTALANVGVSGYAGGVGDTVLAGFVAAAALTGSADAVSVAIKGHLGQGGSGAKSGVNSTANAIVLAPDNGSNGYETWNISADSQTFVELGQGAGAGGTFGPGSTFGNGVGSATTLKLTGAGPIEVSALARGDWANLKTIDASAVTGSVVITGALDNPGDDGLVGTVGDIGQGHGVAGLLDGNTALTSFIGSTKASNTIDVTSFTATQVAALTASGNTVATNTIDVSTAVATTTTKATFANITGFQVLGVGHDGDEVGGTIDLANLPASVDTILFNDEQGKLLTINNVTSHLTVAGNDQWSGKGLTVGAVGPNAGFTDVLDITLGTTNPGVTGNKANSGIDLGALKVFGEETVNLASNDPSPGKGTTNTVGNIEFTPTPGAAELLNITGNDSTTTGTIFIVGPGTLAINDTNTGVLHIKAVGSVSTNATAINASASAGLIMDGADTFFSGTTGAVITGSATGHNQIIGGHGGDVITGGTGGDTIWTNGGADTIKLGTPGAHDDIHISGFPSKWSMTNNFNEAQPGFWGVAPGATTGVPIFDPAGIFSATNGTATGTSADIVTISNFDVGLGASTDQLIFHGASNGGNAWGPIGGVQNNSQGGTAWGISAGNFGLFPAAGDAHFAPVGPLLPNADVIQVSANLPNAAALASFLHSTGTALVTPTALANNQDFHILFAYSSGDGVNIADVDILNNSGANQTSTANMNVYASDLVHLTGVSLASLTEHNVQFV
jgi:hypothetical protein